MPIVMMPDKKGRARLGVRTPIVEGSYANVSTRLVQVRVYHQPGLMHNGWPALLPDLTSMSEKTQATIERARRSKLDSLMTYHRRAHGAAPSDAEIEGMRARAYAPIICEPIAIHRALIFIMPHGVRGTFDFGTVTRIVIHNKGAAPVTV